MCAQEKTAYCLSFSARTRHASISLMKSEQGTSPLNQTGGTPPIPRKHAAERFYCEKDMRHSGAKPLWEHPYLQVLREYSGGRISYRIGFGTYDEGDYLASRSALALQISGGCKLCQKWLLSDFNNTPEAAWSVGICSEYETEATCVPSEFRLPYITEDQVVVHKQNSKEDIAEEYGSEDYTFVKLSAYAAIEGHFNEHLSQIICKISNEKLIVESAVRMDGFDHGEISLKNRKIYASISDPSGPSRFSRISFTTSGYDTVPWAEVAEKADAIRSAFLARANMLIWWTNQTAAGFHGLGFSSVPRSWRTPEGTIPQNLDGSPGNAASFYLEPPQPGRIAEQEAAEVSFKQGVLSQLSYTNIHIASKHPFVRVDWGIWKSRLSESEETRPVAGASDIGWALWDSINAQKERNSKKETPVVGGEESQDCLQLHEVEECLRHSLARMKESVLWDDDTIVFWAQLMWARFGLGVLKWSITAWCATSPESEFVPVAEIILKHIKAERSARRSRKAA